MLSAERISGRRSSVVGSRIDPTPLYDRQFVSSLLRLRRDQRWASRALDPHSIGHLNHKLEKYQVRRINNYLVSVDLGLPDSTLENKPVHVERKPESISRFVFSLSLTASPFGFDRSPPVPMLHSPQKRTRGKSSAIKSPPVYRDHRRKARAKSRYFAQTLEILKRDDAQKENVHEDEHCHPSGIRTGSSPEPR